MYYFVLAEISGKLSFEIDDSAHREFSCQGIEEFSMDEPEVDAMLGERSYSGGDVPESVIDEVDYNKTGYKHSKKFYFANEEAAKKFQSFLKETHGVESQLKSEEAKDWNEEWRKSYEAIDIDGMFTIIPEWEKETQTDKNKSLLIYPGQGFGTGSHETTFLCLKQFFKYRSNKEFSQCLDFGCGSGILGLAARKIYPNLAVDLYDIDQAALENTNQNIELNELDKKNLNLLLPKGREKINQKYELVFANILQNVLLAEKDYLANSVEENGLLILSGLLKGQEQEVIDAYKEANPFLELIEVSQKNDWVAVIMEHE